MASSAIDTRALCYQLNSIGAVVLGRASRPVHLPPMLCRSSFATVARVARPGRAAVTPATARARMNARMITTITTAAT